MMMMMLSNPIGCDHHNYCHGNLRLCSWLSYKYFFAIILGHLDKGKRIWSLVNYQSKSALQVKMKTTVFIVVGVLLKCWYYVQFLCVLKCVSYLRCNFLNWVDCNYLVDNILSFRTLHASFPSSLPNSQVMSHRWSGYYSHQDMKDFLLEEGFSAVNRMLNTFWRCHKQGDSSWLIICVWLY